MATPARFRVDLSIHDLLMDSNLRPPVPPAAKGMTLPEPVFPQYPELLNDPGPEVYEGVVKQLTSLYDGACEQLRTVGLSASAPERLARLLLNWSANVKPTQQGTQITVHLTHEEIAEFLGTTRETVTRTLSDFKTRNLLKLQGSTMMISNRAALESIGAQ